MDVFPEFDPPLVEVQTEALGLSAAEVESLITVPLEADLLNGVAWLDDMRSQSVAGLSTIVLEFEPGTDPIQARQMVQERLTQAHALPNVSTPPVMLQPVSSNSRVMMVGLSSDNLSLVDLGVLARWNIKPRLVGVEGVSNVSIWGHRDRQLQVLVDPATLNEAGVTLDQVIKTSGEALWVSPLTFLESSKPGTGGFIDTPNQRLSIRHLLPIATPEDLGKVPVVDHPDLTIADIATVAEGHQQLIGDALVDGKSGMILVIERFPDADPVAVTQDIEATLSTMRAGLPGVDIDTEIFRPAGYVESMSNNLFTAIGTGLLLAFLVLALFAWSWRRAVIGVVVILTSLSAAVLTLGLLGESLNLMTIGGLLVALAVVVDEVSVDTDAARRRTREADDRTGLGRTAAFFSAMETRRAMLPAAIILILVILPVYFLRGLSADFFSPLATSYVISVATAFVVALILTPGLTVLLSGDAESAAPSPVTGRLVSIHDSAARAAGRLSRGVVVAFAVVLAGAGLTALLLMDAALTPTLQQDTAMIRWEAKPGTSPDVMVETLGSVGGEVRAIDGVESVSAHIGRAVTGDLTVNVNTAQLWIRFREGADRTATVDAIEQVTERLAGSVRIFDTYIPERLHETLSGREPDVRVRVYGTDIRDIEAKANEIAGVLDVVDGVSAVSVDAAVLEPELQVKVDLAQANRYGILPGDVRRQATTLISGLQVGSLFEEQKVFDVVVWGEPDLRDEARDFDELLIDLPDGAQVQLSELASIETVDSPLTIERDAVSRFADVEVSVSGRSQAAVADDVRSALQEVAFPQEYRAEVSVPGDWWPPALLIVGALIAIYLVIQAAFGGWRLALGIMVSVLFALLGAVIGAIVIGGEITFAVLFGLLAVLGLALRHALLVVDGARRLELDATDAAEPDAIRRAVRERFPAMVATSAMVAVILVPSLVMGNAPGLEVLRPMAVVVLFGLVTSMVSTVIVIPALYDLVGFVGPPEDPIDIRVLDEAPEPSELLVGSPSAEAHAAASTGGGDDDS